MNYWQLIEMFLTAAPAEVALVKSIVDAVHDAHQTGAPLPVFVPAPPAVPEGAIALPIGPPPNVPQDKPVSIVAPVSIMAPVHTMEAQVSTQPGQALPVVVTGVPGLKRDRSIVNTALSPGA